MHLMANQPKELMKYVDGISITLESPRQHIWTYSGAYKDDSPCHLLTVFIIVKVEIGAHIIIAYSIYLIHYGMDRTVQPTVDVVHNWEFCGSIEGPLYL